jgi:hypothetical protein
MPTIVYLKPLCLWVSQVYFANPVTASFFSPWASVALTFILLSLQLLCPCPFPGCALLPLSSSILGLLLFSVALTPQRSLSYSANHFFHTGYFGAFLRGSELSTKHKVSHRHLGLNEQKPPSPQFFCPSAPAQSATSHHIFSVTHPGATA